MKRERRQVLSGIAALGIAGFLQRSFAAGANPVPAGLHRIRGSVKVNGQPAEAGRLIRPGDTVTTGPDAEALYVIGQDAFLQRAGTEVSFGADAAADFMRLITGSILSVFGRGDKRIRTATATIGIRGTACYLEEQARRTYFCLCYGEAEVVPAAAPATRELIRTSHHEHPIYIHGDPAMPTAMVPATVINHSDAELTMLEGLVGRLPPFYGRSYSYY